MAVRLDKAFECGADALYPLQPSSELAQAKRKALHIKVERFSPAA